MSRQNFRHSPTWESSLWTAAINTTRLLSVYFVPSLTFNCSCFLLFHINSCCRNRCLLGGLPAMSLASGAFRRPRISSAFFQQELLTAFPLFPKLKFLKRIKRAQFIFFTHRRSWKKYLLVSQLSQLREKRGERSHGPQRTFSSAEAMCKAVFSLQELWSS